MLLLVLIILTLFLLWIPLPHVWRLLGERRLRALCRARKAIVLTFDDGPGAHLTEDLANLLDDRNAKASFFILGRRAQCRPKIVQRLLRSGHEIGSHTMEHLHAWKAAPWAVVGDVRAGARYARTIGGGRAFRPPYGKIILPSLIQALFGGLRLAWWTIDSGDSQTPRSAEDITAQIVREGGGIVLMHDLDGFDDGGVRTAYVLETTQIILDFAAREGYRILTFAALADSGWNDGARA